MNEDGSKENEQQAARQMCVAYRTRLCGVLSVSVTVNSYAGVYAKPTQEGESKEGEHKAEKQIVVAYRPGT